MPFQLWVKIELGGLMVRRIQARYRRNLRTVVINVSASRLRLTLIEGRLFDRVLSRIIARKLVLDDDKFWILHPRSLESPLSTTPEHHRGHLVGFDLTLRVVMTIVLDIYRILYNLLLLDYSAVAIPDSHF